LKSALEQLKSSLANRQANVLDQFQELKNLR